MSFGNWTSIKNAMEHMRKELMPKTNMLIVDLSNDVILAALCQGVRIMSGAYTQIGSEGFDLSSVANQVDNSQYIACGVRHDLGLLAMDWSHVLLNIQRLAKGRQVLILLPQLNSFASMATFVKLGTLKNQGLKTYYTVIGAPYSLLQAQSTIPYLNKENYKLIAIECFTNVKPILADVAKVCTLLPFKNGIDYNKLGLL